MPALTFAISDDLAQLELKYFYRENGHVRLQPAHPQLPSLYYHPSQVVVQGRALLVIRQAG
jgi:SOS-response transcriptional repressor LexA